MCLKLSKKHWIRKWFVRDKTLEKPILDIQSFKCIEE